MNSSFITWMPGISCELSAVFLKMQHNSKYRLVQIIGGSLRFNCLAFLFPRRLSILARVLTQMR